MDGNPLQPVQPDDDPQSFCHKHHIKYNPYRGACPECEKAEVHRKARKEWQKIKYERCDVHLNHGGGLLEVPAEVEVLVEWKGVSDVLTLVEVEEYGSPAPSRAFRVKGVSATFLDDEVREAILSELGRYMMSIPELVG